MRISSRGLHFEDGIGDRQNGDLAFTTLPQLCHNFATTLPQLCHNFATCPTSCPSLPIYIYIYLYKKFEELLLSHIKSPSAHVENQNVSLFLLVSRPQLNISQTTAGSLRLTPSNCASSGASCHSCHCQKSRTRNMCLNNSKYTNAIATSCNQEYPAFFLSFRFSIQAIGNSSSCGLVDYSQNIPWMLN